jgi:hypothetical protein
MSNFVEFPLQVPTSKACCFIQTRVRQRIKLPADPVFPCNADNAAETLHHHASPCSSKQQSVGSKVDSGFSRVVSAKANNVYLMSQNQLSTLSSDHLHGKSSSSSSSFRWPGAADPVVTSCSTGLGDPPGPLRDLSCASSSSTRSLRISFADLQCDGDSDGDSGVSSGVMATVVVAVVAAVVVTVVAAVVVAVVVVVVVAHRQYSFD